MVGMFYLQHVLKQNEGLNKMVTRKMSNRDLLTTMRHNSFDYVMEYLATFHAKHTPAILTKCKEILAKRFDDKLQFLKREYLIDRSEINKMKKELHKLF